MGTVNDIDPEGLFSFGKSLALIVVFFTLTPVALIVSLFSLHSLSKTQSIQYEINQKSANFLESPRSGIRVYASLPDKPSSVSSEIESKDARPVIIKKYLEEYNSPLQDLSEFIIRASDENGLDYRLLTAIAQQESNLCKKIPENTFNCWGWGIHTQGTLGFSSFENGINIVAKGLKENYADKGFKTPQEIMTKYTPHSPNGAWANGVTNFMEEML